MKKRSRFYYNLVEITLAMAVVGIGIAGIMALFVPALEASKESIAEDYSSQVATTLLAYIERQKKANWNSQFVPGSGEPEAPAALSFGTEAPYVGLPNTSSWTNQVLPNLYDLGSGIYGLKIGDGSQFCAFAKVWAENTTVQNSTGNVTIPNTNSVRLKVEIAWPATVPDGRRQKRYYILDLGRPQ